MIAQVMATLIHLPILQSILCNYYPDDPVFGIGLATSISSFIKLLLISGIRLLSSDIRQSYISPYIVICSTSRDEYFEFISIDLSSMAQLCAEGWALQLLTIFASYFSDEAQAVQGAFSVISGIVVMFGVGFSDASSVIVGNMIGANRVGFAWHYA